MTKTTIIFAATVFVAGFATAALAQGVRAPDIYGPPVGVGATYGVQFGATNPVFTTPPPWHPSVAVPTYQIPSSAFRSPCGPTPWAGC